MFVCLAANATSVWKAQTDIPGLGPCPFLLHGPGPTSKSPNLIWSDVPPNSGCPMELTLMGVGCLFCWSWPASSPDCTRIRGHMLGMCLSQSSQDTASLSQHILSAWQWREADGLISQCQWTGWQEASCTCPVGYQRQRQLCHSVMNSSLSDCTQQYLLFRAITKILNRCWRS